MEQRWIPVSERLPEQPKENPVFEGKKLELYLVTVEGDSYPFRAFWNGKTFTDGWRVVEVVAWMPLPESDSPHPVNARILTHKESAEWDAYRELGTPEELKTAMQYVRLAKAHGTVGQVIEKCAEYEEIGTPEECRAAVEKQIPKSRIIIEGKYFCPACKNLMLYPGYCGCGQRVH